MAAADGPAIPQSVASSGRRGDIQGLRAVAVLLVVAYHAELGFSGGFVGVDVFFVISGYVITRTLTAELDRHQRIRFGRFYLRRIRRLLPALAVMLTVVLLASGLLSSIGGQEATARTGAAAAVLNANTYLIRFGGDGGYFDIDANVNALLHTWSLSVEEQFYLVFPALLIAAWLLGRKLPLLGSRLAIGISLVAISALSFLLSWALSTGRTGLLPIDDLADQFAFYSSLTRAWEFAAGGVLALVGARLIRVGRISTTLAATTGFALVAYSAIVFDDRTIFPGSAALVPVVGTLCIIAAGEQQTQNPVNRALSVRPAQYLGNLSYSWYLWHWPFIVFAAALWPTTNHLIVVAAVASLLPAWLSSTYIEGPIRFAAHPRARTTLMLAAACILVPVASAVVLNSTTSVLRDSEVIAEFERDLEIHIDVVEGCDAEEPHGSREMPQCTWSTPAGNRSAVLIGDSAAGQFSEAFVGAADARGYDATITTFSACPFVDLIIVRDGRINEECRSFVTQSLRALVETPPSTVLIASCSACYIEDSDFDLIDASSGHTTSSPDDKAAIWTAGLAAVIQPLAASGSNVVVLHVTPSPGVFDPRECAAIRVLIEVESCAASTDRAAAESARQRAIDAETSAVEATAATALDVADILCPGGSCAAHRDGQWIWRDSRHITVGTAELLTPQFEALFPP